MFTSDREADPVAIRFAAMGYHAFVLRYSVYSNSGVKFPMPGQSPAYKKSVYPGPTRAIGMAMLLIRSHAEDLIAKRLAPADIPNDGKQTPMRGHPVFIGQHATGTCCRGCLEKWHGIRKGHELTKAEQAYVVDVLMQWIERQMKGYL